MEQYGWVDDRALPRQLDIAIAREHNAQPKTLSSSRQKHRESNVWQRRFWEPTLHIEAELSHYLGYVHYNLVKHGLVNDPHQWPYSSFHPLVGQGGYQRDWACQCSGAITDFTGLLEYDAST